MTIDSQWAVQQAILTVLQTDSGLTALLAGGSASVYDHVPQSSAYPYIAIGEATARPGEADNNDGDIMAQTVTIHSWSRHRGMKEVKEIMGEVVGALNRASLSVTGFNVLESRFEFSETFMDPDTITRHGVQRFRITTQVTA